MVLRSVLVSEVMAKEVDVALPRLAVVEKRLPAVSAVDDEYGKTEFCVVDVAMT